MQTAQPSWLAQLALYSTNTRGDLNYKSVTPRIEYPPLTSDTRNEKSGEGYPCARKIPWGLSSELGVVSTPLI